MVSRLSFVALILTLLSLTACHSPQKVVSAKDSFLKIDTTLKPDAKTEALISSYRNQLKNGLDRVIGETETQLTKKQIECSLGNFAVEAMYIEMKKLYPELTTSMVTFGGLRAPLPKGKIKVADMYELMPFDNLMVVQKLSGKDLKALVQQGYEGKNMAVYGMKASISKGILTKLSINGAEIQDANLYTMAVSDYLASGGDRLSILTKQETVLNSQLMLRNLFIKYFEGLTAQGKKASATDSGSWQVID